MLACAGQNPRYYLLCTVAVCFVTLSWQRVTSDKLLDAGQYSNFVLTVGAFILTFIITSAGCPCGGAPSALLGFQTPGDASLGFPNVAGQVPNDMVFPTDAPQGLTEDEQIRRRIAKIQEKRMLKEMAQRDGFFNRNIIKAEKLTKDPRFLTPDINYVPRRAFEVVGYNEQNANTNFAQAPSSAPGGGGADVLAITPQWKPGTNDPGQFSRVSHQDFDSDVPVQGCGFPCFYKAPVGFGDNVNMATGAQPVMHPLNNFPTTNWCPHAPYYHNTAPMHKF